MPTETPDGVSDRSLADATGRIWAYVFDLDAPTLVDTGLPTTEGLVDGIDAVVDAYDAETYVSEPTNLDAGQEPAHRETAWRPGWTVRDHPRPRTPSTSPNRWR